MVFTISRIRFEMFGDSKRNIVHNTRTVMSRVTQLPFNISFGIVTMYIKRMEGGGVLFMFWNTFDLFGREVFHTFHIYIPYGKNDENKCRKLGCYYYYLTRCYFTDFYFLKQKIKTTTQYCWKSVIGLVHRLNGANTFTTDDDGGK